MASALTRTHATCQRVAPVTELTQWLKQLIDAQSVAKAQAEHHDNPYVAKQHRALLAHYQSQIKNVEQNQKTGQEEDWDFSNALNA